MEWWRMLMENGRRRSGSELGEPPSNEIWYLSTDGNIVEPLVADFSSTIVSNTYADGYGRIVFYDAVLMNIGYMSFSSRENLKEIIIPEGVTYIGSMAFASCPNLQKITFPSSLASMSSMVLYSTPLLREIVCKAIVPPTLGSELRESYANRVYVPITSVEAYKADTYWKKLTNIYGKEF